MCQCKGTVPRGATCVNPYECTPGNICINDTARGYGIRCREVCDTGAPVCSTGGFSCYLLGPFGTSWGACAP